MATSMQRPILASKLFSRFDGVCDGHKFVVLRLSFLLAICLTVGQVHGQVINFNLPTSHNTHTALGDASTGVYDPIDIYGVPGGFGVAFLLPPLPLNVPRGGVTGGFLDFRGILETEFPDDPNDPNDWSFVTAGADLVDGALEITAYDVFGGSYVGIDGTANTSGFAVRVPEDKDPAGNEHWIQVIRDNHALPDPPGSHGTEEHKVDTPSLLGSPYYDDGALADSRNFFDIPRRTDEQASHLWLADLALVTGPAADAPGEVTIYNGIRYGWANVVFTVNTLSELHDSFNDLFDLDKLGTELGTDLTGILDTSSLQGIHDEFHVALESVPEPATYALAIFSLLSLATYGRQRKRS